ncbi:GGDEF domain-containing protein [Ahrensia sp. R2A130]|uniref:GGDEF domain-containing protein n=1 Tax=Ahrensia sp. R2A130 TaxID=744979 RepID=UPI0001E08C47|nr:GGDEF domain-containing protein [Ahrensia sp. R2A130]EFL89557.1 diguanylate cyclase [Ahrensia sp. R2A130]
MSEQTLLQLLQPMTYAIMAAGFCSIYLYSRELRSAKFWALSYMFGSIAFLLDFSFIVNMTHLSSWTANMFYFLASSMFVIGHFVRLKRPVPIKTITALGAGIVISMIMFRHVMPDTATRTIAMNLFNALIFMLPISALLRPNEKRPKIPLVDKVAGVVLVFFVATFFVRIGLLASGTIDQNLTDSGYVTSWMASSFRIVTTFCAIGSAVALYVMLGIDMTARLQRRTQIDSMTTLLNKHTFEIQANLLISPGRSAEGRGHSLVVCDIDNFKAINDTLGHAAGDVVIAWIGRILGNTVRTSDLAGRVGGEEFALLLRDCNEQDAAAVAEALRDVVSSHAMDIEGRKIAVTASFGVAHAHFSESFPELFDRADKQLYRAKENGRNCVCVAPQDYSRAQRQTENIVRPSEFQRPPVARAG